MAYAYAMYAVAECETLDGGERKQALSVSLLRSVTFLLTDTGIGNAK